MGARLARFILMIQIVIPCYVYAIMSPIVTNTYVTPIINTPRVIAHYSWSFTEVGGVDGIIPCAGQMGCSFGVVAYYTWKGKPPPQTHHIIMRPAGVVVTKGMTWSQAANAFIDHMGRSGSYQMEWRWLPSKWDVCIGVGKGGGTDTLGAPLTNFGNACVAVPETSVTCSLEGNVEIDHGMLQPGQVDGHKASVNHLLQCTGEATVKLQIIPEMTDLGGGVKSLLIVNDVINGGHFTTTEGTSAIKITSRLSGTAATPGKHSGSTVVLMSVQ